MWQLGEVERARELIEQANRRARELGHAPSMVHPLQWKSHLEILRGDPDAALIAAEALEELSREQGLPFWRTVAELNAGWVRGRLHDAATGAEDLRQALSDRIEQGGGVSSWFYTVLLAQLEAKALGTESALARLDEAMALARQVETRCNLPFLHLLRGELLLKHDPSNPAPAEEAFRTALAIAQEQGARSWGLRAALSLAKFYQSTARPVEAHAVLAPALEGFAPTPEMPEIAEAQTVLATLADTSEVNAAEAQRQRRLHLQTAYGQAMLWSKGFATEETSAAFARAAELAATSPDFSARFAAAHGQWALAAMRGELRLVREMVSPLLARAEELNRAVEVGVARRVLGFVCYLAGDFDKAQDHFEKAIDATSSEREQEARERFGEYTGTMAKSHLGLTKWQLGKVNRARELIDLAHRSAADLGHVPSMTTPIFAQFYLAIIRGDASAAMNAAEALRVLSREHGLALQSISAEMSLAWARGRLHNAVAGAEELEHWFGEYRKLGVNVHAPFYHGLLAELELEALGADSALVRIDEVLAQQIEVRCDLGFLPRLRGNILL
jgi:tetratricopeptide (TPR) repeat protein